MSPGYNPCSVAASLVKAWEASRVRFEEYSNCGCVLVISESEVGSGFSQFIFFSRSRYRKPATSSRVQARIVSFHTSDRCCWRRSRNQSCEELLPGDGGESLIQGVHRDFNCLAQWRAWRRGAKFEDVVAVKRFIHVTGGLVLIESGRAYIKVALHGQVSTSAGQPPGPTTRLWSVQT